MLRLCVNYDYNILPFDFKKFFLTWSVIKHVSNIRYMKKTDKKILMLRLI